MSILFTVLAMIFLVAIAGTLDKILPFNFPLPFMQILFGALIAWPDIGFHVEFNPELFLLLFIPPLLFEDGRRMPLHEFMRSSREILSLAMVLVFITVAGVGALIHLVIPSMPLVVAFALAAVLSPTDAVALSSIVGKGRLSKPMNQILEGEALMNDASALVSLKFAIAVAIGATTLNSLEDYGVLGLTFLKMAIGGILVGILFTLLYIRIMRYLGNFHEEEPATQMILLLLLPFTVYAVAEVMGLSGILSAVSAGMTIGYSRIFQAAPISLRLRANSIWSLLEYILNGTVFLMLGLQIPGILKNSLAQLELDPTITFMALFSDIFIIYGALMAVRFLWLLFLRTFSPLFTPHKPMKFSRFTFRELLILTFSGVRGTVTLAAALSIPFYISTTPLTPFPARYQVLFLSVGIILLSLIVAVVVLPLLLKKFTLDLTEIMENEKEVRAELTAAATEAVKTLENRLLTPEVDETNTMIINEIASRIIHDTERSNGQLEHSKFADEVEIRTRFAAIRAQRGKLYQLHAEKQIAPENYTKMLYEIDLAETLLLGRTQSKSSKETPDISAENEKKSVVETSQNPPSFNVREKSDKENIAVEETETDKPPLK